MLDIEELLNGLWAGPENNPQSKAKLATTESLAIHVSPSGDDANDGSQNNPVATLSEALSRVPKRVLHDTVVYVDYGDYTADPAPRVYHHTVTPENNEKFRIVGYDPDNPFYDSNKTNTDITFSYGVSSGNRGSEAIRVIGIQIDGFWQTYDDILQFEDCDFANGGGTSLGNGGQGLRGLDGYLSNVRVVNCHFHDMERAFTAAQLFDILVKDLTAGNISDEAFQLTTGSTAYMRNSNSIVNNAAKNPLVEESCVVRGGNRGFKTNDDGSLEVRNDGFVRFGIDHHSIKSDAGSDNLEIVGRNGAAVRVFDGGAGAEDQVMSWRVGATVVLSGYPIKFADGSGGTVELFAENGELKTTDNDNNTTTLS